MHTRAACSLKSRCLIWPRSAKRILQSEGLVKERSAGRQLYGGYGTTVPGLKRFLPLPTKSKLKNPANTSILVWGERVFALYL